MTPEEIDRLRHRLRNRPRTCTYQDIADATGLNVRWLADFQKTNRRVRKVNCIALRNFLDEQRIGV